MYEDTARPCRPDAYVIISELVGWEGEVRGGRGSATYLGDPSSLGTVAGLSDARHSSLGTFSVRRRHCGRPYVGASERTSLMWPYLEEGAAMDADDDLQAAVSVSKIPCKWGTERIEVRLKSESQQCPGQELLLTVYSTILLPEPHIRPMYMLAACVPHCLLKQFILQLRRHSVSSTQNREVMPCAALASLSSFYWPTFMTFSEQLRG
jgi:hypothetical protein